MHGDQQSKLTLMSESLRNDGRIWVPKKIEDVKALRSGAKKPSDIAEEDRDYYLSAVIRPSVTSCRATWRRVPPKSVVTRASA